MEEFKAVFEAIRNRTTDFKSINFEGLTSYPLIGRGKQGVVFKLSNDRCIKIYKTETNAMDELAVLQAAQDSTIVPKIYNTGPNYIIMEYIEGPSLKEYLQSQSTFPKHLTGKILSLIKEMKRLNFTRLDAALRHIILTGQGELKVVDHVNSFKKQFSRPEKMMKGLEELGLLDSFMEQVQEMDPQLYREWKDA